MVSITREICLSAIVLVSLLTTAYGQHGSFANTKFDLGDNLPAEEPPPSSNVDSKPEIVTKQPEPHSPSQPSPTATTPIPATISITTFQPPQPISVNQPAQPLPTLPSIFTVSPSSIGSSLPVPLAPAVVPAITITPITPIIPISPATTLTHQRVQSLQRPAGFATQRKVQLPPLTNRPDLWFRDDYDLRLCPREGGRISQAFRQKLPVNLLKGGKESLLADLLANRIMECQQKRRKDHWNTMERYIDSLTGISPTEREECRAGLIQEQISCLNVFSYSCQFIQSSYTFKLIPTRIIVTEARLVDDGAEKCSKFARTRKFSRAQV